MLIQYTGTCKYISHPFEYSSLYNHFDPSKHMLSLIVQFGKHAAMQCIGMRFLACLGKICLHLHPNQRVSYIRSHCYAKMTRLATGAK